MDASVWCDEFIQKIYISVKVQDAHNQINSVEKGTSLDPNWAGLILQATHQLLAVVLEIATTTRYELHQIMVRSTQPPNTEAPLDQLIQTFLKSEAPKNVLSKNVNVASTVTSVSPEDETTGSSIVVSISGTTQQLTQPTLNKNLKAECKEEIFQKNGPLPGKEDLVDHEVEEEKSAKRRRRKMPRTGIKRIVSPNASGAQSSRLRQRPTRSKSQPIAEELSEENNDENSEVEDSEKDESFSTQETDNSPQRKRGCKRKYTDKAASEDDGLLAHRLKFSTYHCFLCTPQVAFEDRDALSRHLLDTHITVTDNGKRGLACHICRATKPLKKLRSFWGEMEEVQAALVKVLQHLYLVHSQKVPPYITVWQCPHCEYFTVRKYNHRTHLQCHAEPSPCTLCGTLIKPSCMKVHLMSCRNNIHGRKPGSGFQCPECGKIFALKNGLSVHVNRIHKRTKTISCYVCSKVFLTQKEFNAHLFNKHSLNLDNKKVFKCDQCNFQDLSATELKKHKQKVHNSSHHLCDTCGKVFNHPTYLSKHKRIHERKELLCPECPYVTNRKEAMDTHIAAQHKNQRVSCPAGCGYSTGYTGNMTKHLKKCGQHQQQQQQQQGQASKTFSCPSDCGYQATQPGNLARHTHHCKAFQGLVEAGLIDPTSKVCVPVVKGDASSSGARATRASSAKPAAHGSTPGITQVEEGEASSQVDIIQARDNPVDLGVTATDRDTVGEEAEGVTLQTLLPPSINPPQLLQQLPTSNQDNSTALVFGGSHGNLVTGEIYTTNEGNSLTNKLMYPSYF